MIVISIHSFKSFSIPFPFKVDFIWRAFFLIFFLFFYDLFFFFSFTAKISVRSLQWMAAVTFAMQALLDNFDSKFLFKVVSFFLSWKLFLLFPFLNVRSAWFRKKKNLLTNKNFTSTTIAQSRFDVSFLEAFSMSSSVQYGPTFCKKLILLFFHSKRYGCWKKKC